MMKLRQPYIAVIEPPKKPDAMAQDWWTFLWASTTIPVEKIDPVAKTVTVARETNIFYYAATSNNVFTLENGLPALDRHGEQASNLARAERLRTHAERGVGLRGRLLVLHRRDAVRDFPFETRDLAVPERVSGITTVSCPAALYDQHQLLALVAPRRLSVGSGAQDDWAGPAGERAANMSSAGIMP